MEPLTTEAVRAAIAQTVELGAWYLSKPGIDSGSILLPGVIFLLVGALMLLAIGGEQTAKAWAGRAGAVCLAGIGVLAFWTFLRPLDAALVEPAKVVMAADAYLRGAPTPEGTPSVGDFLNARYRLHMALGEADYTLRKLCLAGVEVCPDGKQSLKTAQLLLALTR